MVELRKRKAPAEAAPSPPAKKSSNAVKKAIESAKELALAYKNRLQQLCDATVPKKIVTRVTLSPDVLSAVKR